MSLITTLPHNLEGRFIFIETIGDGNCLFHAIANGIRRHNPQSKDTHISLRAMMCAHYKDAANIEDLRIAAISKYNDDTLETRTQYIDYICKENTWGTDNEIFILSRITPYHIEVYDNDGNKTTGDAPANKPIIYLWNHKYTTDSKVANHFSLLLAADQHDAVAAPAGSLANLAKLAQIPAKSDPAEEVKKQQIKSLYDMLLIAESAGLSEKELSDQAMKNGLTKEEIAEIKQYVAVAKAKEKELAKTKSAAPVASLANLAKLAQPQVAIAQADSPNPALIKQQQAELDRIAEAKKKSEDAATQQLLAQYAAENAKAQEELAKKETIAAAKAAGLSDKEIEALLKQKGGKQSVGLSNLAKLK